MFVGPRAKPHEFLDLRNRPSIGLDALGDELASPFDTGKNALPLSTIARTVEINVLEQIGVEDLPDPLRPVEYLLE